MLPASSLDDLEQVWAIDFEFRPEGGNQAGNPIPVCVAGYEFHSGRRVQQWLDGGPPGQCPFDNGPRTAIVAYFASAEIGCYLALGWPIPWNVVDLYAEFRLRNNGTRLNHRRKLLEVLQDNGLPGMSDARKEAMRERVVAGPPYSVEEQKEIMSYCSEDAESLVYLLERSRLRLDLPRALIRGRYMVACARMERVGTPVDVSGWQRLIRGRAPLLDRIIREQDRPYGVYGDNLKWSDKRFLQMLRARGIPWRRTEDSGRPVLDKDYLKEQCQIYPKLEGLRQLRKTIKWLQEPKLAIGPDGRNRVLTSPFGAVTSRNTPQLGPFIFGAARWLRALICAESGYAIAYLDWQAQEIAIAAALSGDEQLRADYLTGDPYLAFAIATGLLHANVGDTERKRIRNIVKVVFLATNYGQSAFGLATRLQILLPEAEDLIRLHQQRYPQYWRWIRRVLDHADLASWVWSKLGWSMPITDRTRESELLNWPMQTHGAELMRIAAIALTEAGIRVCCPVHDAFLIEAPVSQIDDCVRYAAETMSRAAECLLGIRITAEAKVFCSPARFDEGKDDAATMWRRVENWLGDIEKENVIWATSIISTNTPSPSL